MSPGSILWFAMGKPRLPEGLSRRAPCALCGETWGNEMDLSFHYVFPRKKVLKPTFTNLDILARPDAEYICQPCAYALGEPMFRRTSFLATSEAFTPLKRDGLAAALSNLPTKPFLFVVTTSYKKHLWLEAPINHHRHVPTVRFDQVNIGFHIDLALDLFQTVEKLYSVFSKTEIESGNYYPTRIQEFGIPAWERLESTLRPHRGRPLLGLLLYMANKREELRPCPNKSEERSQGSTPSTKPATPKKSPQETQLQLF